MGDTLNGSDYNLSLSSCFFTGVAQPTNLIDDQLVTIWIEYIKLVFIIWFNYYTLCSTSLANGAAVGGGASGHGREDWLISLPTSFDHYYSGCTSTPSSLE